MALTMLELKALGAADHGRSLTDGGSLKGKVYVARDGAVSVQFRFAYKFGGKFREVLVGTWPKADITTVPGTGSTRSSNSNTQPAKPADVP